MLARLSTDSGRSFQGLAPKDPDMVGTLVASDGKLSEKLISVQETAKVGLMTCVLGRVAIRPDITLQRAEVHGLFLLPQNKVEVAEV